MTPAPSSTLRDPTPIAPQHAVEAAEHVAAVARMRNAMSFALPMWLTGLGFDLSSAKTIAPGAIRPVVVMRLLGGIPLVATWLRMRAARRPTPTEFRIWSIACFSIVSALLSAIGATATGITSPYFGGVMLVLVFYGAVMNEPWQLGLVSAAGPFLAYPLTMLGGSVVSATIAGQLADATAKSVFTANAGNLALSYLVVVGAGHAAWKLRRQVFETRSLGRYKLKRRIGAGGMGEVWIAHHATLDREVAVKILRPDHVWRDASAVARFEREVRATTELAHPNTVRVFDYGVTDDGICFFAMELLHGENLATLSAREGALAPERAVRLIAQAARALAEAHAKGIVHRDVKPENLFVTRLGHEGDFVKVLDFGVAKIASENGDATLTQAGSVIGTPAWLAPETIRGASIDAGADVYALGAVLYLLLSGHPPFEAASGIAVVSAHLHELPVPPSAKRGEPLPSEVDALVLRCLAKDPADRFPSAHELAEALGELSRAKVGEAPRGAP